jgi:hypothetical protein
MNYEFITPASQNVTSKNATSNKLLITTSPFVHRSPVIFV